VKMIRNKIEQAIDMFHLSDRLGNPPNQALAVFRCAALAAVFGCGLLGAPVVSAQGLTPQQSSVQSKAADEAQRRLEEQDAASTVKQTGSGIVTDPIIRRDLPPPGGPKVRLRSITIGPESAFLTQAELDPIAAKYRGKRVDFSQISELVRDINDLYAAKGIVTAAAILPPQNLSAGNLEILLVEGQLGNVALVGEHQTKNDFIFDRITLAKGTTVDVPTAAKDIERFNATNRAQLRLLLQPGAAFGYTDLLLGITEPPENEFQIFLDNEGVSSTGEWQMSAVWRRYGLLGVDDTFLMYGAISDGSRSATARYEFPINTYGTRLAASLTTSDIVVVSGPTSTLNVTGKSNSANLSLSHPFFIDQNWTVLGTASAFVGTSSSKSAAVPIVDTKTVKYAPGVTLSYSGAKGSFSTQIQGVFAESTDKIAASQRDVFLLAGSVNGSYRFDNGLTFVGSGAWQHANENLLPGNLLFQIGGPTTVRGYPSDGIAGDSGYYASLELYKRLGADGSGPDGFAFLDFGQVFSTFPKQTTLVSAGVGLNYRFNDNINGSLTLAAPMRQAVTNQSEFVLTGSLTLSAF
jgi:hemolysin activation/secretion protein